MVQLGVYNFLNLIFVTFIFFILEYIGLENIRSPKEYISKKLDLKALEFLKNIEQKKPFSFWIRLDKDSNFQKKDLQIIGIVLGLTVISFSIIFYFFNLDNYTFSNEWYLNLERIINLDSQIWFSNGNRLIGESALINLYSQTIQVSPEIAQQSISIIENTLLVYILFWSVSQITPSKFVAPLLATLFFISAFTIVPVNVYYVIKNNPLYFALTFAIPAMVFILKPEILNLRKRKFFFFLTVCFLAIGLTQLLVFLVCIPLFILVTLILNCKKNNSFYGLSIASYLTSVILILSTYWVVCIFQKIDFIYFLHSNLIYVSSFTYLPYLEESYNNLMKFYVINALIGSAVMLFLSWKNKENWKNALVFMFFYNGIILLSYLNHPWLDKDLIILMIPLFLPITIGINVAILIRIIDPIFKNRKRLSYLFYGSYSIAFVFFVFSFQKNTLIKLEQTYKTPKMVLNAYDQITTAFIPYTYAVVNDNSAQLMSTNKHYFITYDYFLNKYLDQDFVYFKNLKNIEYLKEHPECVLPNSVLVFIYEIEPNHDSHSFKKSSLIKNEILKKIKTLVQRGRLVKMIFSSNELKVYEIVNTPRKSKTKDLIYEK
jgi:hypothetical protein